MRGYNRITGKPTWHKPATRRKFNEYKLEKIFVDITIYSIMLVFGLLIGCVEYIIHIIKETKSENC